MPFTDTDKDQINMIEIAQKLNFANTTDEEGGGFVKTTSGNQLEENDVHTNYEDT